METYVTIKRFFYITFFFFTVFLLRYNLCTLFQKCQVCDIMVVSDLQLLKVILLFINGVIKPLKYFIK